VAAKKLSDYFTGTLTADYTTTLVINAQGEVTEEGYKNQVVHLADDNSEERVTLVTGSIFYVTWNLNQLSESDAGTVFDHYNDPAKANGMGKTFKWTAHDGTTYVARWDCKLSRSGNAVSRWGIKGLKLRVLGIST
jgi:hypothetical protein